MKDIQIIMLGTGNAGVTRCYNTCFAIRTAENVLLVDAGKLAEELKVKNLLLYHTEDKMLNMRKACYTEEAAQEFSGVVHVPDDLEIIDIIVN